MLSSDLAIFLLISTYYGLFRRFTVFASGTDANAALNLWLPMKEHAELTGAGNCAIIHVTSTLVLVTYGPGLPFSGAFYATVPVNGAFSLSLQIREMLRSLETDLA